MRTIAAAIARSIWARHQTGFITAAAVLLALVVAFPLLGPVAPAGAVATSGTVLLVGAFALILNSLLLVEDRGSLSSRFPRHMLTLPVRTRALAFWPMLFASSGAASLWVAAALLIYRPAGYQLPVVIPALGLAALMAWAQALAWLPIAGSLLREVINILLVAALAALPIWMTLTGRGSSELITTLLIVYITAAYVLAWSALTSDRRGDDWRFWPARLTLATIGWPRALARRKRAFRSPFEAQVWYEWNCHGLMLNGFVGAMLFSVWTILIVSGRHATPEWFALVIGILVIAVVATVAASGVSVGRFKPFWTQFHGFVIAGTFVPTRPMTTGRLVAAKFRMAAASVLWTWALAVAGTTFWIVESGNLDNATVVARDFFNRYPGWRGSAIIALACILLPALSWRLLTGLVAPVLAGRRWVSDGAVWALLALVASLGGIASWLANHPEYHARFYSAAPWIVVGIALLKGAAAVAAFRATACQGLMSWRNIVAVLSLWLCLTGCGVAAAVLALPASALPLSRPILALCIATLVPLVRFPLATLALDWNRHR